MRVAGELRPEAELGILEVGEVRVEAADLLDEPALHPHGAAAGVNEPGQEGQALEPGLLQLAAGAADPAAVQPVEVDAAGDDGVVGERRAHGGEPALARHVVGVAEGHRRRPGGGDPGVEREGLARPFRGVDDPHAPAPGAPRQRPRNSAAEPSVEPLSARMISHGRSQRCATRPSRVSARVAAPFRQAMITLSAGAALAVMDARSHRPQLGRTGQGAGRFRDPAPGTIRRFPGKHLGRGECAERIDHELQPT